MKGVRIFWVSKRQGCKKNAICVHTADELFSSCSETAVSHLKMSKWVFLDRLLYMQTCVVLFLKYHCQQYIVCPLTGKLQLPEQVRLHRVSLWPCCLNCQSNTHTQRSSSRGFDAIGLSLICPQRCFSFLNDKIIWTTNLENHFYILECPKNISFKDCICRSSYDILLVQWNLYNFCNKTLKYVFYHFTHIDRNLEID